MIGTRAVRLYPLYHPAAALYTPSTLEALRDDFHRIPSLLALGPPEQPAIREPVPEVEELPEVEERIPEIDEQIAALGEPIPERARSGVAGGGEQAAQLGLF